MEALGESGWGTGERIGGDGQNIGGAQDVVCVGVGRQRTGLGKFHREGVAEFFMRNRRFGTVMEGGVGGVGGARRVGNLRAREISNFKN
jgi:hypothetical protein